MTIPLRHALAALAFTLAYGGFTIACPGWTHQLGLDVWNYSAEEAVHQNNRKRFDELTQEGDRVKRRLALKAVIAQDLIDGRTTLPSAVDQYTELNHSAPEVMSTLRVAYPHKSDVEIVGRQVIVFAAGRLEEGSSQREEFRCRLESELRDLLGKSTVRTE
jgi:hypothetical protein